MVSPAMGFFKWGFRVPLRGSFKDSFKGFIGVPLRAASQGSIRVPVKVRRPLKGDPA